MTMQAADQLSKEPAWPVFMAKLLGRRNVADGTMAFEFEKPAAWTFDAGQFIDMTLLTVLSTEQTNSPRREAPELQCAAKLAVAL